MTAPIAYFVFLRRSAKNMAAKFIAYSVMLILIAYNVLFY